jgi:hypothetical protein
MQAFSGVIQTLFQLLIHALGDLSLEREGNVRRFGAVRAGFRH